MTYPVICASPSRILGSHPDLSHDIGNSRSLRLPSLVKGSDIISGNIIQGKLGGFRTYLL